jgi:hypothetical protein
VVVHSLIVSEPGWPTGDIGAKKEWELDSPKENPNSPFLTHSNISLCWKVYFRIEC